ncbi:MAG: hypothetical protein NTV98_00080 [Candidatus Roizmanbacteria bacterium]|nr:hypothetical protein [Candidatus Roizmanbacteria bacterium]
MNKKNIITAFLLLSVHYFFVIPTCAINMQSGEYRIQMGTVDSGGGKMTDPVDNSYNLSSSIGQSAAKEFQSNGYVVKAGFQYLYSRIPFSFYLSTIRVDLGTLLPNSPRTGDITMKVSFGGAGQYIVTARADTPLSEVQGTDTISFTGCNGGADTCTITNAKLWTSASAYGFGYAMTGQDIPSDFISSSYFRPFANRLTSENPATIMQSTNVTADITPTPAIPYTPAPVLTGVPRATTHQAIITMKANVSGLQPAGTYAAVIRFLATPSF